MRGLIFTAALVLAVCQTRAAELFDNGSPNPSAGGVASNFGHDPEYEYQSADDFTLATGASISQVRWWGLYQGSNIPLQPDAFTLRIFSDAGGVPSITPLFEEQLVRVRRHATGETSGGYDVYEYTANLTPHVALPAGTYWLSIVEDVDAEELGTAWLWALSDNTQGNHAHRTVDGLPWELQHSFTLAFELRGAARK